MTRPVTNLIGIVIPQRIFEESLRYAKAHRMNQSLVLAHAWDTFSVSAGMKQRARKPRPYLCRQDKGICTDQFGLDGGLIGCNSNTICEHKFRMVRKLKRKVRSRKLRNKSKFSKG